jgi:hypothetical protein
VAGLGGRIPFAASAASGISALSVPAAAVGLSNMVTGFSDGVGFAAGLQPQQRQNQRNQIADQLDEIFGNGDHSNHLLSVDRGDIARNDQPWMLRMSARRVQ